MLPSLFLLAVASLLSLLAPSSSHAQTAPVNANGTLRMNFVGNAPFPIRQEAGSAVWTKPLTFTMVGSGQSVTWQPPFVVLYGGERLNDVWVTSDSGSTWQVVSGVGSAMPMNGLDDQSRTADCYDADNLYLVGGTSFSQHSSNVSRSQSVTSWEMYTQQAFYRRQRSTCAVNSAGGVFVFGGLTIVPPETTRATDTNDVWMSASHGTAWTLVTQQAEWWRRQGHNSEFVRTPTGQEVLYVMNGYIGGDDRRWNDIWTSTDNARSFQRLNPAGSYMGRMDSQLTVASNGVMVISAGDCGDLCNLNDVWASLDGGYTWGQCCAQCGFEIREDHVQELDRSGRLLLFSGSRQNNAPRNGNTNDVWLSDVSFTDTQAVGRACGLKQPNGGVGLRCIPGGYCPVHPLGNARGQGLVMQRMNDAPWVPRFEGGMAYYPKTLSFTPAEGGAAKRLTNPFIMYGGRGSYSTQQGVVFNDVWALDTASDQWWLIGGVTPDGVQSAASKLSNAAPLQDQGRTADCYDSTGRMYAIAGTDASNVKTSRVYVSVDGGIRWTLASANAPFVGREAAACATGSKGEVWVMAGALDDNDVDYLQDVWQSLDFGRTWRLRTSAAPWSKRTQADADVLLNATAFGGVDILYFANGYDGVKWPGQRQNDVWVSSDGGQRWAAVTLNAPYRGRQDGQLIVTATGALITVAGDVGINYPGNFNDIHASLDGGYTWGLCNLTAGFSPREDHVAIIDSRSYLWVTQGEAPDSPMPKNDVWRSTTPLSDTNLASLCSLTRPRCGTGLKCWPTSSQCGTRATQHCPAETPVDPEPEPTPTPTPDQPSSGLSAGYIVLIVAVVLAVAAGAFFLYHKYFVASRANSAAGKEALNSQLLGTAPATSDGAYHQLDIGRGQQTNGQL